MADASAGEQAFARDSAAVFDRSRRGILDLSGNGVGGFLQGIFSSSVTSLEPGAGQASAFLSARGRLIAAFHLHALPGGVYRMALLEPVRETLVKQLERYCFLADVEVRDRGAELRSLSIEGPAAERIIERLAGGGAVPPSPRHFRPARLAGAEVAVVRGGESPEGGFDIWVPRDAFEAVRSAAVDAAGAEGGGEAGPEAAEALRIEAGIPHHGKDYGDDSFPNEVGWEHALTYDKCYVGQEIVARMRTYGHANRRLKGLIFLQGESPPAAGSAVLVGGEEAGRITSSAVSARLGRAIALALIQRKSWGAASASVAAGGSAIEAEVVDLPIVRADLSTS